MRSLVSMLLGLVVMSLAGCGSGQATVYSVKGVLTKDGKPLGDVHLMLTPNGAGNRTSASADVAADGSFELKCSDGRMGAAAGSYKVVLAKKAKDDGMAGMKAAMSQMKAPSGGGPPDMSKMMGGGGSEPFPAEYADPAKTPGKFEVFPENTDKAEIKL